MTNSLINDTDADKKDNELNLNLLINLFKRNKTLISSSTIIFFVLSSFISLFIKRTWEGQFQIVVEPENQSLTNPLLGSISGLGGLGGKGNRQSLTTEVEILKSPSVLMPVFEFYLANSDEEEAQKKSFSSWKNNLKIELERGTSVLKVAYRDKNKSLIIPILDKTSLSYQEYSGKGKRREQELKRNFLNDQISFFTKKSSDSLKTVQKYAMDYDLIIPDSTPFFSDNFGGSGGQTINGSGLLGGSGNQSLKAPQSITNIMAPTILPNVGLENIRVLAANEIRKIDLQLKKIKELKDVRDLQYIGSTIPALVREGLPQVLKKIEEQLVELRSKYTDNDPSVIRLLEKRELTIDFLKERAIKYLEVARVDAEARMESAMRPKGVLLKYKELIREASRDEITLINLENQLRLLDLNQATIQDPWELITKPTLFSSPVAPSRKRIALLSSIFGFILGLTFSIYKEKKSGKIVCTEEIKKLLPVKFISEINLNNIDSEKQKLLFLKDYINKNSKGDLFFIDIENTDSEAFENFKKVLKKQDFFKEVNFASSEQLLDKTKIDDSKYLIVKIGLTNYKDVLMLKQRKEFLDIKFDGIIILK